MPTPLPQQDNSELLQDIEALRSDISSKDRQITELSDRVKKMEDMFKVHNHTGIDGTQKLRTGFELSPSEKIQLGNFRLEEISDFNALDNQFGFLVVGKDKEDTQQSDNLQFVLENQANTNGSTNQSFVHAERYPLVQGKSGSVSSGGSTMTTTEYKFMTDELVGAQLIAYNSDLSSFDSKIITANKSTTITVSGTWSFTNSKTTWIIMMPVYLGSAEFPWRQVYVGGQDVSSGSTGAQRRAIRLGHGPTSSCQAIYFGSGSPESVVTAVVGSLYLRSDGSTSTTLYIKTSGSGNTGWTAK